MRDTLDDGLIPDPQEKRRLVLSGKEYSELKHVRNSDDLRLLDHGTPEEFGMKCLRAVLARPLEHPLLFTPYYPMLLWGGDIKVDYPYLPPDILEAFASDNQKISTGETSGFLDPLNIGIYTLEDRAAKTRNAALIQKKQEPINPSDLFDKPQDLSSHVAKTALAEKMAEVLISICQLANSETIKQATLKAEIKLLFNQVILHEPHQRTDAIASVLIGVNLLLRHPICTPDLAAAAIDTITSDAGIQATISKTVKTKGALSIAIAGLGETIDQVPKFAQWCAGMFAQMIEEDPRNTAEVHLWHTTLPRCIVDSLADSNEQLSYFGTSFAGKDPVIAAYAAQVWRHYIQLADESAQQKHVEHFLTAVFTTPTTVNDLQLVNKAQLLLKVCVPPHIAAQAAVKALINKDLTVQQRGIDTKKRAVQAVVDNFQQNFVYFTLINTDVLKAAVEDAVKLIPSGETGADPRRNLLEFFQPVEPTSITLDKTALAIKTIQGVDEKSTEKNRAKRIREKNILCAIEDDTSPESYVHTAIKVALSQDKPVQAFNVYTKAHLLFSPEARAFVATYYPDKLAAFDHDLVIILSTASPAIGTLKNPFNIADKLLLAAARKEKDSPTVEVDSNSEQRLVAEKLVAISKRPGGNQVTQGWLLLLNELDRLSKDRRFYCRRWSIVLGAVSNLYISTEQARASTFGKELTRKIAANTEIIAKKAREHGDFEYFCTYYNWFSEDKTAQNPQLITTNVALMEEYLSTDQTGFLPGGIGGFKVEQLDSKGEMMRRSAKIRAQVIKHFRESPDPYNVGIATVYLRAYIQIMPAAERADLCEQLSKEFFPTSESFNDHRLVERCTLFFSYFLHGARAEAIVEKVIRRKDIWPEIGMEISCDSGVIATALQSNYEFFRMISVEEIELGIENFWRKQSTGAHYRNLIKEAAQTSGVVDKQQLKTDLAAQVSIGLLEPKTFTIDESDSEITGYRLTPDQSDSSNPASFVVELIHKTKHSRGISMTSIELVFKDGEMLHAECFAALEPALTNDEKEQLASFGLYVAHQFLVRQKNNQAAAPVGDLTDSTPPPPPSRDEAIVIEPGLARPRALNDIVNSLSSRTRREKAAERKALRVVLKANETRLLAIVDHRAEPDDLAQLVVFHFDINTQTYQRLPVAEIVDAYATGVFADQAQLTSKGWSILKTAPHTQALGYTLTNHQTVDDSQKSLPIQTGLWTLKPKAKSAAAETNYEAYVASGLQALSGIENTTTVNHVLLVDDQVEAVTTTKEGLKSIPVESYLPAGTPITANYTAAQLKGTAEERTTISAISGSRLSLPATVALKIRNPGWFQEWRKAQLAPFEKEIEQLQKRISQADEIGDADERQSLIQSLTQELSNILVDKADEEEKLQEIENKTRIRLEAEHTKETILNRLLELIQTLDAQNFDKQAQKIDTAELLLRAHQPTPKEYEALDDALLEQITNPDKSINVAAGMKLYDHLQKSRTLERDQVDSSSLSYQLNPPLVDVVIPQVTVSNTFNRGEYVGIVEMINKLKEHTAKNAGSISSADQH